MIAAGSFPDTVASLTEVITGPVLLMTSPVLLPAMGLGSALEALDGDARVVSVSFLSNAAGHLSFPQKNKPTQYSLEGHDETTLTRLPAQQRAGARTGADRGAGRWRDAGQPRLPGDDQGARPTCSPAIPRPPWSRW